MFDTSMPLEERIRLAKQAAGQKVERKTQNYETTIYSTQRKYRETEKMIQSYEKKIERLTKQKEDLIRKESKSSQVPRGSNSLGE